MPRETPTTRCLPLTEDERKILVDTPMFMEHSSVPARSYGVFRRLRHRLGTDGEPNIPRVLDVSTAHLTEDERGDLELGALPCQIAETDFGGILHSSGFDTEKTDDLPPGVIKTTVAIMRHAIARGCGYVMFDADSPTLPGFPVFETEEV
jgi:hypothetical protein